MNRQRIFIGITWLASLVAVYFVGGMGGSDKSAGDSGRLTKDASAVEGEFIQRDRAIVRKVDESGDSEAGKRPKVVDLVAKVQLELGNCTEGMMGIHSMLRALGPIADLDEA